MPRSGIAGSYSNSSFRFLRTSLLFSIVAAPVYIPTNSAEGFLFIQSLPTFIVCRLISDGCSDQCEVVPHCDFNLLLSNNELC